MILAVLDHLFKKNPNSKNFQAIYERYRNHTMISKNMYTDNLSLCFQFRDIEGCIVECGVWKGGMAAGMAQVLPHKKIFLFDSFEGLPEAKPKDGENALFWQKNVNGSSYFNNCKAELEDAYAIMKECGSDFEIIKGWFDQTLTQFHPKEKIAILRLDADWYDSTMLCLRNLYPHVSESGIIIIDDYLTWDGCSRAVHDYLSEISSASKLSVTGYGVPYLIKRDK